MPVSKEKLEEIRERTISKVLWGEHDSLVLEFLKEQGLDEPERERIFEEARLQKIKIVRTRSFSKLMLGFVLTAAFAAWPFVVIFKLKTGSGPLGPRELILITACIFVAAMSLMFTIRNLRAFLKANEARAALSE
ncbi:MAG: hypothetical protein HKN23_00260 [Verrucomicrobiales bacterium]|nr:hypothetical protein [Verrucomicrobiales bacterium]